MDLCRKNEGASSNFPGSTAGRRRAGRWARLGLLLTWVAPAVPALAQRPGTLTPQTNTNPAPGAAPHRLPNSAGQPNVGGTSLPGQGGAANGAAGPAAASPTAYGQYPVVPGMPEGVPLSQALGPTDTLHVTLDQALERFIQRNYNLIAQRFNVNVAQAAVVQSGVRDNPNVLLLGNAYNPNTRKFFPFGKGLVSEDGSVVNGNTVNWQVQQLINLSRSRAKLVELSSTNVEVQQAAFEDLLRNSRYQLAQTFYNVVAERRKLELLQRQREQLDRLLVGFREQLRLGTVAAFEVTRLELERVSVEKDRSDQLVRLGQDEATLRVFLAAAGTTFVSPEGQPPLPDMPATLPALPDLAKLADQYRPDLRSATRQIDYAKQNLRLQRALAVPKLALALNYANYGNAYNGFYGLQASMDVPVFNRNQGNVQAAQVGIQQGGTALSQTQLQVEQDVAAAVEQLQRAAELRRRITPQYVASIQDVGRNATRDYQLHLIDLVNFIDKFRAYTDAQTDLIDVANRVEQAKQQVNFVTNTPVFKD